MLRLHWLSHISGSPAGKWVVVAAWAVAALLVTFFGPTLAEVRSDELEQFLPSDSETAQVGALAAERFAEEGLALVAVFHNPEGLQAADFEGIASFAEWLRTGDAADMVTGVLAPVGQDEAQLVAPDGRTALVTAQYLLQAGTPEFVEGIEAIRDAARLFGAEGTQIEVGGSAGFLADLQEVFDRIDDFLLGITIGLVVVLLLIVYRSPIVAMVPLLAVGAVYQLTQSLGTWVAQGFDFNVSGQAIGIMTVVLWGTGTDYTLFVSARYREELGRHLDKHQAIRESIRNVGGAVLAAGATIIVAAAILLLADLELYRSSGPIIAVAAGLMLLAALTLVPALLAILGRRAYWPFQPRYEPGEAGEQRREGRVYGAVGRFVVARPATVLGVALGALLILFGGLLWYDPDYNQLESLPEGSESVAAADLLQIGFPAGQAAPTRAMVDLGEGAEVLSAPGLESVDAIVQSLAALEVVTDVRGPSRPFGMAIDIGPREVLAALEAVGPDGAAPEQPAANAAGVDPALLAETALGFVDLAGEVAELSIILAIDPYSIEALDSIADLRARADEAARAAGLPAGKVLVGGPTAAAADVREVNSRDTAVVLPVILLAIAIALVILLRSLVAPLYLSVTILFTYFSTLGLSLVVFRWVLGEATSPYLAFFLFVFLNALSIDYNIYLMSRVREEARRLPVPDATQVALSRTGGVITSAGLILAGTFAALMTIPMRDLVQVGFAVALGVLMDTFVTRTMIVPSIVTLLGRWNWWPSGKSREGEQSLSR
jgi:putative drug exporter of the RND superfamily